MDYQAALYDPIYIVQGVPATLRMGAVSFEITALDKTAGVNLDMSGRDARRAPVDVQTLVPAAAVRRTELIAKGVTIDDLRDSILAINGYEWTVKSWRPRPSPRGENDGELYLFLEEKTEVASESESS